uniref:Receptor L-domain domain-containing protein n=1 Tax=Mucochytrium quahogii TaxID=96639 RepID=A0A7S2WSX0_9STRA|mmetsp:Transcript_9502/g.20609  ORF Transcript_9502/g.20609 Transcript_9502/m.20609 type:complete len:597 (+) Transcript_9502:126-1916(+)
MRGAVGALPLVLSATVFEVSTASYGFFHEGYGLNWRHEPFTPWTTVLPLNYRPVDEYPACDGAIPCHGDVDLSTDERAGSCESVTGGNVVITGVIKFMPTCLTKTVKGDVVVENNDGISSFSGFGRLVEIDGNLIIKNNANLVSLRGLDQLEIVTGNFELHGNGAPLTLSELDKLVITERFTQNLETNYIRDEVLHFPRRRSMVEEIERAPRQSTLFLQDTYSALISLYGLGAIQEIGGNFVIRNNPELIDFTGMPQLRSVGGDMRIEGNHKLVSFSGVSSIADIGGVFSVLFNSKLASLSGMGSLSVVGSSFVIERNEVLAELGDLVSLVTVGGDMVIRRNDKLVEIRPSGSELLGLNFVSKDVVIEDNPVLSSLYGFGQTTSIGGSLEILRNPKLLSLQNGFVSLKSIGAHMFVQGEFVDYSGLGQLETVEGKLVIHSLPYLDNLLGLDSLGLVGGDLVIYQNPSLKSVGELVSLKKVTGRLQILENKLLEDVDGMLDSLEVVLGYLQIHFYNGTIDCPKGTGILAGERPLIFDTWKNTTEPHVEATEYGNWCTLNCRYPMLVRSEKGMRMWESQQGDLWSKPACPYCVEPATE